MPLETADRQTVGRTKLQEKFPGSTFDCVVRALETAPQSIFDLAPATTICVAEQPSDLASYAKGERKTSSR